VSLPALADAPAFYDVLDFDAVPLKPDGKEAALPGWPRRDPADLWAAAPAGANVGIRGGGRAAAAFVDCDEARQPGTLANVQNHLWGLGYEPGSYPVVQSASGPGRHVYLSLVGTLPGDARHLAASVGAGEFRYGPGALVVACPSTVGQNAYRLLAGDYRNLARVTVADVLPLVGNKTLDLAPRVRVPARAWAMLQGHGIDRYASRSEAEQAIIAMLINAEHDFTDVARLFQTNPAFGKFAELNARGKAGLRWLRLCFAKAEEWANASESEGRQLARAALAWGEARAWPGRTGSADRAVFLAHAQIALRAGRLTYGAACRELAELAGVSHMTASTATGRLLRAAFVTLHEANTVSRPSVYRLCVPNVATFTITMPAERPNFYTPSDTHVRECKSLAASDAFRPRALGKAAGDVWAALRDGRETVAQLAKATGRPARTVRRVLQRMARIVDPATGEIMSALALVQADGRQWRALPAVDLDRVALVLGTAGKGKHQRDSYRRERRDHQRALHRGAAGEWGK
jgi:hypothetical protein